MGRFFFENSFDVSESKPALTQTTVPRKYHNSGSEKFNRVDFSTLFGPE